MKASKCNRVALFALAVIVVVAGTTGSAQACSQHATQATNDVGPADCQPKCLSDGSSDVRPAVTTSESSEFAPPAAASAETNVWGWRYVTHYGCGWTALYPVELCTTNLLWCPNCHQYFTAFVC